MATQIDSVGRYLDFQITAYEFFKSECDKRGHNYMASCLPERTVKKYGVNYGAWSPRPDDVNQDTMKECFSNAFHLALRSPKKYIYVEGFAFSSIPTCHAWCVDLKGNVVDPTWKEGVEYFGIPFKLDFLIQESDKNRTYGLLYSDTIFRIKRGEYVEEDFIDKRGLIGDKK